MSKTKPPRFGFAMYLLLAIALGVFTGWLELNFIQILAKILSTAVLNILKLISIPILFLSVVSNLSQMDGLREFKQLGMRLIRYTLFTTFIAACIALAVYLFIHPSHPPVDGSGSDILPTASEGGLLPIFINMIPSNLAQVVMENQVIGVMIIAVGFGLAILTLEEEQRAPLRNVFSSLFAAILKITGWILYIMPFAVWAFVNLFVANFQKNGLEELTPFIYYVITIVSANLIQGLIVLPLLLKFRGISPIKTFKGMFPAITLGFLARSSNAALPLSLQCAKDRLGISPKVSQFSFPLCATINMNACAAFILITFFFVATSYGLNFSIGEQIIWVFVATIAAVGNAGVPMGCYFMTTALIVAMGLPLELMGLILPLYTFLDMIETGLNIWSDSSIVSIVDKELKE